MKGVKGDGCADPARQKRGTGKSGWGTQTGASSRWLVLIDHVVHSAPDPAIGVSEKLHHRSPRSAAQRRRPVSLLVSERDPPE